MADDRVDVLVVSAMLPWPLESGGQMRLHQLLGATRGHRRLSLVVDGFAAGSPEDAEALRQMWPDVSIWAGQTDAMSQTRCPAPRRMLGRARHLADRALATTSPRRSTLRFRRHPETVREIRRRLADKPDLVQVEFTSALRYVPPDPACPVLLVAHDVFARRDPRARGVQGAARWVELGGWRTLRHERQAFRRADMVVVTSELDREAAAEAGARNVRLVPSGAPDGLFDLASVDDEVRPLFVGAAWHSPNRDALEWWSDAVAPLLPDSLRLRVAGVGWSDLRGRAGLEPIGFVADPLDLFADSVVVAPLRVGGGTKLKVVEAMAAGRAILATPIAVEGLPLVDGSSVLLAASPSEMATALRRLVTDAELRRRLGAAAREAARPFAWSAIEGLMEAVYCEVLSA